MTKKEILAAFDNVITQLGEALDKQTSLNPYLKIQARIEAYTDARNLISNALPDEDGDDTVPADAEPVSEAAVSEVVKPTKSTKK